MLCTAQELAMLDGMLAHFSKKKKQYTEYHRICEQVYYYGPGASKAAFFWAFLIAGVTTVVMLILCILGKFGEAAIVFAVSNVPCFFLVGGGLLVHRKNRQNYRKCCQRYLELAQELMAYYTAFGPCTLGPEYTDPQTLAAIRGRLASGQAASMADSTQQILSRVSRHALESHISSLQKYTEHLPAMPVFYPGRFFSADPREFRDFLKHKL